MPFASTLSRALLAFGLACVLWPAAGAVAGEATSVEPHQVRDWLMRIHNAASQRNFAGTLVVSANGGPLSSARIAHFCEGGNQYERIESLDGRPRHMFRVNESVQTVWPGSRVAVVEQRNAVKSFPALLQAGDDRIADFYDLRPDGQARIAGLQADVLTLKPRDDHRYGYRLWADRQTGLLLRADVLGLRGEMLETSAFSDVTIGVKPQPAGIVHGMKKLDGYQVLRPLLQPTRLETEGWRMASRVPGFQQVSCVKRSLEPATADQAAAGPGAPALQAIFSDGLTYVSVFIESDDPHRNLHEALMTSGATQTLRRRRGEHWVTVVGDVPLATLRAFADGLEHEK